MKSQTITIAIVVAAGVAMFVGSKSSYDSMARARDLFYSSTGFAEGFVSLKKAPQSTRSRIAETSGVAHVESRIVQEAALDFAGERLPSAGRFMSLPEKLSRLAVRNIPTICIDGNVAFASMIPDQNSLVARLEAAIAAKAKRA